MSVLAKHAYRTQFLKSEWWQNFRLEVLVANKGRCRVCGFASHDNDVHHVFYRGSWKHTMQKDVCVLCRDCHTAAHELLEDGWAKGLKHSWDGMSKFLKLIDPIKKARGLAERQCPGCSLRSASGTKLTVQAGYDAPVEVRYCQDCIKIAQAFDMSACKSNGEIFSKIRRTIRNGLTETPSP